MSALPKPMPRDFDQVQRDLEQSTYRLKNTRCDPKLRRELLKQLRLLLEEADLITVSTSDENSN